MLFMMTFDELNLVYLRWSNDEINVAYDETYLVYNDEFDEINPIVGWITDDMLT